jgi:TonB family protein
MLKPIFLITISLLFCREAFAQKKDTSVYYLKNSGKVVSSKDSADYFLVILPPDTSVDKNLFVVKEYYKNGKIRLMGNSRTNDLDLKFEGSQISFFPNGHRMKICSYDNGVPVDAMTEYYPNGKFYDKKLYIKTVTEETDLVLKDCSDSTGNVLAKDGNGKWIKWNADFTGIIARGAIENGHEEGSWILKDNYNVEYSCEYQKGVIISRNDLHTPGAVGSGPTEQVPEFPGGLDAFIRFIQRNTHYPNAARTDNISGQVTVSFVVERDGTIIEIKVQRGLGHGCDEEAVRVMKLSPRWKPGMQNGKPVRVAYSVPISFGIN